MVKENKIGRTLLHIIFGLMVMILVSYYNQTLLLLFYLLILGIILSLLSLYIKIPILSYFLDNFELEKHRKALPGKSFLFFIAGNLIVIRFFPQNIALASIAILTFADPVSHFASKIGKKYKSKFLNQEKSLLGTLAAILVAILASSFFIPLKLSIPASILAMSAETLILKIHNEYIDDDFVIPLIASLTARIFSII